MKLAANQPLPELKSPGESLQRREEEAEVGGRRACNVAKKKQRFGDRRNEEESSDRETVPEVVAGGRGRRSGGCVGVEVVGAEVFPSLLSGRRVHQRDFLQKRRDPK